ncbi:hypothetical protein SprV_1002818600 [Sparganum proliferum]
MISAIDSTWSTRIESTSISPSNASEQFSTPTYLPNTTRSELAEFTNDTTEDHLSSAPGPPRWVRAWPVSTTSVEVSWSPPYETNGEIANYTVRIDRPNLFMCYYHGSGPGSCRLHYLQKGTAYKLYVFACNKPDANGRGGGCGSHSGSITVVTWTGQLNSSILYNMKLDLPWMEEGTSQASLHLPLGSIPLQTTGPLRAVTLVVDKSGWTYANQTDGSWEVIVLNGTSSQTYLYDRTFVLGDGNGRPKSSHYYKGPLEPETTYSVTPVKVEYFSNYVVHLLEPPNDNIGLQFQLLNIIASQQADHYRLTTQLGQLFPGRNRSSAHPPYDQTLVLLDRTWPQYKERLRTVLPPVNLYNYVYIDASYVTACAYHQESGTAVIPDYDTPPSFIVTASPRVSTHARFLSMVVQQCPALVVLLGGKSDIPNYSEEHYWPEEELTQFVTDEGSCEVTLAESWDVNQLHFLAWPAKRPPRVAVFYDFVQFYLSLLSELPASKKTGPPIIHSSADDGREGIFICAVLLLQQLRSEIDFVDVFGTVLALRKCRSDLVITKEHLGFLYSFVGYCIMRETNAEVWPAGSSPSERTLDAIDGIMGVFKRLLQKKKVAGRDSLQDQTWSHSELA